MIQMENNSGSHCWIPASQTQSLAGNLSDGKQNIQVQYSTNNQQTMYNAPCSIYNVPTITLPPNPSHTYIIQEASHQGQNLQPTFIQQNNNTNNTSSTKEDFLKCRHWPTCKFYTSNQQSLKNHELTHFAQQSLYTCTDCNLHFTNKSSKDEHTRRKHKTWAKVYSCSHCNFETSLIDEYSEHNVQFHLDTGSTSQIYQCHQCNYSTSWKCFMDSHLLVHSNNELDYRSNKKTKFDNFAKNDTNSVTSPKSDSSGSQPNLAKPDPSTTRSPNGLQQVPTVSSLTPAKPSTSSNSSCNNSSTILQTPPQTTLSNIAPMPTATITQLTTLASSSSYNKEYRCNMCHHFTTSCQHTFHQHIKSHNTCQNCGFTSNSISDLSLHVCHSYDGQNTYTNAILNNETTPPMNFAAMNSASMNSQYIANPNTYTDNNGAGSLGNNNGSVPTSTSNQTSKKRPNRQIIDDDFQEGIYRCRKCDYGTSWKCFLDSHMLTHGGVN